MKADLKEIKKRYYWKNLAKRNASKNDNSFFSQSYADELNEQIMYLQKEKLQLEERMQDFVANKVNFFHNGKYDENIRTVYQDLLYMGLSTRNVEKVIEIVLRVIDKWNTLTDFEQKYFNSINRFFCGFHVLVGLADQAEASIKSWEGILIGDAKVGSLHHGSYSKGESGTLRLIRTVCKSVSERVCQKSGRMVNFATFLKENYNMSEIPLLSFFMKSL